MSWRPRLQLTARFCRKYHFRESESGPVGIPVRVLTLSPTLHGVQYYKCRFRRRLALHVLNACLQHIHAI